jgi:hypothetical protein
LYIQDKKEITYPNKEADFKTEDNIRMEEGREREG